MHDLIGIRIILPDRDSCYSALGVVHAAMTPVPGRFKDYIAIPRPTGYQSLHTTVVFDGAEVEIQIRSETMHVQARYGVAAHFLYKDKSPRKKRHAPTPTAQDSELVSALAAATSPEDFLEKLRLDLAPEEEVVVLTPKGRPIVLSADATVLDFAYKIHTDVGHRCTGARINGLLVPIRSTLRTGDVVEVITGSKPAPKPDWLNVVKTARAREKIRKFLDQATNDPVSEGRTQLLDELRARNATHRIEDQVFLARLATTNGFNSTPDMLKALASGTRPASTLMGLPSKQATKVLRKTTPTSSFESAVADALDGLPFSLPRCCRASNIENSTGLVSRLHDVSVHESSCASLASTVKDLPPGDIYRLIPLLRGDYVSWLEVHAEDRTGLLRDVSACLAEAEADIAWSSTITSDIAILRFRLSSRLPDRAQLRSSLASLAGVVEVYAV
jgi:GTP pyrophosphokinase